MPTLVKRCAEAHPRVYDGRMRICQSPGTLKRFRRTAWDCQQTFQTALKDLPRFVDVILGALPRTEGALAVFDQVVFEPRYELVPLYAKYALPQNWSGDGLAVEARGVPEMRELLQALLSEWIDF